MAGMEHPFLALEGGDTDTRRYKSGYTTVVVALDAEYGMAAIFNKDIWIYAVSKSQQAVNNHEPVSRTVYFSPYDFFVTTNRAI